MRCLADEGVDRQIVDKLREAEHEVLYIAEIEPGISDQVVLERARESGVLLVTTDKDFGELVFRQGLYAKGVVLLRLAGLSQSAKAEIVANVFAQHGSEMAQAFSVISPGMVRIRRGPFHEHKT
jgi:predicted nuclease of predicted toxin-antitoxin system